MTVEQLSLDHASAEAARASGIRHALGNADPDYRERFTDAILRLARSGRQFCSDDVRALAGDPPAGQSPNIAGALITAAKKAGLIRFVAYTKSTRVVGHSNVVCLYVGTEAAR